MCQRPVFLLRLAPQGLYPVLAPLSGSYPRVQGRLLTCYAPVRHCTQKPKLPFSSDLHVLSTPPAFVLSQDQTLRNSALRFAVGLTLTPQARIVIRLSKSSLGARKSTPPPSSWQEPPSKRWRNDFGHGSSRKFSGVCGWRAEPRCMTGLMLV